MRPAGLVVVTVTVAMAVSGCQSHGGGSAPSAGRSGPTGVVSTSAGDSLLRIEPGAVDLRYGGSAEVLRQGTGWSIPDAVKVKADADSIKLKDDAGTTRWKIRLGDKIKITAGEEDVRCQIESPETGRFKAKSAADVELGSVRSDPRGSRVQEGSDVTVGSSKLPPAASLAVMFCTDVEARARAVIIGELASRGK